MVMKSCAWNENGKCKLYSGNHKCGVSHWRSCKGYINEKVIEREIDKIDKEIREEEVKPC